MHELIPTLNITYKLLNINKSHINCLPLNTLNNINDYDLLLEVPFIEYNSDKGDILIKINKEENKELIKELINNINKIKEDVFTMKNYIKEIMIEDVKYRIKNLKKEYNFIEYNLF